jgi:hypothetical protein
LEEEGKGQDEERHEDAREGEECKAAAATAINEEDSNYCTSSIHGCHNQGK